MESIEAGWQHTSKRTRRYNVKCAFLSHHVVSLASRGVGPAKLNVIFKFPRESLSPPFKVDQITTVELKVDDHVWGKLAGQDLWNFHLEQIATAARVAAEAGALQGLAELEAAIDGVKQNGYIYLGTVGKPVRWNGQVYGLSYRFGPSRLTLYLCRDGAQSADSEILQELEPHFYFLTRAKPRLLATKAALELSLGNELRTLSRVD